MTPGQHLRALRLRAGLTQAALALRVGTARGTVDGHERGHRPIPGQIADAYAEQLGGHAAAFQGYWLPEPWDVSAPLHLRMARYLRELRIDAEITQAELARRTGIHRPIVCRIERGVHMLLPPTLARIGAALRLDWETVLAPLDPQWCAAGAQVAAARRAA